MADNFDSIIEKLQNQIFEEAKEALGELGFQRWRNPIYRGRMDNPDAHARIKGTCGDTMEIFLKFEQGRVKDARPWLPRGRKKNYIVRSFVRIATWTFFLRQKVAIHGRCIAQRHLSNNRDMNRNSFQFSKTSLNCCIRKVPSRQITSPNAFK